MTWTPIVARSFTPTTFRTYVEALSLAAWKPSFTVLHNTGSPTLAQRSEGFTLQNICDLEHFYRDEQHWSAGPHLFIDDRQIWAFTPLTHPGVHSPSWNAVSWGVEMLGDYDKDDFNTGRGANVKRMAAQALAVLAEHGGFPIDDAHLRFHHEDPKTTHKHCPGVTVRKAEVIGLARGAQLMARANVKGTKA